jgi:hypothetical protein
MNDPAGTISDELVYAYVDGELDAATTARFEAALAREPALATRVQQQKALRARLQSQFAHIVEEPVPQRLQSALTATAATVVDLASVRDKRESKTVERGWSWREWGAMAATLVIGTWVGTMIRNSDNPLPLTAHNGQLIATGELRTALSEQLSGADVAGAAVDIGLSIQTSGGQICRSFTLAAGQAGLACRRADDWIVEVISPTTAAGTGEGYRLAATTLPEPVRLALEARTTGEPLTPAAETALKQSGWHASPASTD